MAVTTKKLKIITKNGKPHEVVLSIRQYKKMLDIKDVAEVERIKKKGTSFRKLGNYLKGRA